MTINAQKLLAWLNRYKTNAFNLVKKVPITKQKGTKIKYALAELMDSYIGNEPGLTNVVSDFFIATLINSSKLIYKTDQYYQVDLQPHVSVEIDNTNEIIREGNNFWVVGNFGLPSAFIIKLEECRFIGNKLFVKSVVEKNISSFTSNVHGMKLYGDYIYLSDRPSGVVTPTTITKIHKNTLDAVAYTFPNTLNYQGQTNDLVVYKNYIYILTAKGTGSTASLCRLNLDLTNPTVILTTGTVTAQRVRQSATFIIHNDEVFIPTLLNTASGFNKMGMQVYNLSGSLLRSVNSLPINAGAANATPLAHWMAWHNGKLIISHANQGSTTFHRSLVRMNATTLAVEESIPMTNLITDDNSIIGDYIYLNGETPAAGETVPIQLLKIKYDDFTDYTVEIPVYGNGGSYGSLNPVDPE